MPVTRSSSLNPKDIDAARTLLRFHYDMKALAASSPRREHTMSLRTHGTTASKRLASQIFTRPRRQCSEYTPGMYTETD